jgi:hypothetical protein
MKKISWISLLFLAFVVVVTSCNDENELQPNPVVQNRTESDLENDKDVIVIQPSSVRITQQLDSTVKQMKSNSAGIQLVGYTLETGSPLDLAAVKQEILNDESIIPVYDNVDEELTSTPSFQLRSFTEYSKSSSSISAADIKGHVNDYLTRNVRKGQGRVVLTWEYNGKRFTSICIYDNSGLVYDNILSNVFMFEAAQNNNVADKNNTVLDMGVQQLSKSYTATVRSYIIKWVWGSKRGEIIIKHSILVQGNKIVTNWGSGTAWMTLGSASTRQTSYVLKNSYAQLTWAFAWATPTASFSFSYGGKPAQLSASVSGIGSKGKGSGIHTWYL